MKRVVEILLQFTRRTGLNVEHPPRRAEEFKNEPNSPTAAGLFCRVDFLAGIGILLPMRLGGAVIEDYFTELKGSRV